MILHTVGSRFLKFTFKASLSWVVIVLGFICLSSSCTPSRNLKYFNNLSDSQVIHLPVMEKPQAVIMPDDLLDIKIAGANEATAALLNSYSASSSSVTSTPAATNTPVGYLVDSKGEVEFPIMGKIKAAGLTREEFRDRLRDRVAKYLKEPLVSVRFVNFRFTVLGEVKAPGSFLLPTEKVTVLEALGLSGDMTTYSNRTNVKVIRDSSGNREIGVLDFTDKKIFTSRYYYLQRNDVVYVEADKSKSKYEEFSRMSPIIATLASLVAIAISIIK